MLLLFLSQQALSAPLQKGNTAYLCFKHSLHQNWPEVFAYQVEVIAIFDERLKVKVINSFPMGRVNEEQEPVKGDVMKMSRDKVYSKAEAGVTSGKRFNGKQVCRNLMSNELFRTPEKPSSID
ncbi:MAG: hypothetical protein KAI89_00525 [Emcibacter sp.]|nr:hypothetical protein [Emcibacter sp.]